MQSTKDRTQIPFTVNTIQNNTIYLDNKYYEFIKFHFNIIYKCYPLHP